MDSLSKIIASLTTEHRGALQWFAVQQGKEISWPARLPNGTFLVNKAKGIHKPAGWQYALSVRQSLAGPYADRDPAIHSDGTWTYQYYQEHADPSKRDRTFTNRALLACQRDHVPVGVIRQVKGKPNSRYQVLGLALVRRWREGYFELEGLPPGRVETIVGFEGASKENDSAIEEDFVPANLSDARKRVEASIIRRQGQGQFRKAVLGAYENRCAISGCDLVEALEAAHIFPYLGADTNVIVNGLLLRGDLHTLYDLGLIAIDPIHWRVLVAPKLKSSVYASLSGAFVTLPKRREHQPSRLAVELHLDWAKSRWTTKPRKK